MPQIPPITDAYIDEIIKAPEAFNPALNKTQGVKLRELLKLMRDKMEECCGDSNTDADLIQVTHQELTSLLFANALIPGKHYLLTNYKTTWKLANGNIRRADNFEPIMLFALTSSKLSTEAYSAIYPQDKIFYLAGAVDYDGNIKPYSEEDWLYMNGLIPETGFIYRRIDSFTNRDINFDFRGFWIGDDNSHGSLYFTNNVKIFSVGLDVYNKQPLILGYNSVSNSTVNVGGLYGAAGFNFSVPETYDDLKINISNSFVGILAIDGITDEISFRNSNIKGLYIKNGLPSFNNVNNFQIINPYEINLSHYDSEALALLASEDVKDNVIVADNYTLLISWIGVNNLGTMMNNFSIFSPLQGLD
ncbi:hypothetical protein ASU31_13500 [Pedobacter ginsenosidimutans]|uniref:Uncharacterized protein n=1 Tax=Pedobacter ginsenosidimutans TaxID=687842 RepID=A0A0T5VPA6_9SPHI|nr:hypothetical protein [Pedobacter ginsenosidimutans]KRT15675.1 hypothetical protein ASU31_13500 [Pedobacter ginsenosidimutans]